MLKQKRIFILLTGIFFIGNLNAQESLLQSGPMVGYADMREVLLWVQTNEAATVEFQYYEESAPDRRFETEEFRTNKKTAFTAKLIADQVEPGKKYKYELFINGAKVERPYPMRFQTQPLWQWRTEPPAFKIAVGSCFYVNDSPYDRPGEPYGGDYQTITSLYEKKPDVMLWLGDNTYLREPDWYTRTGIFYRYTHTRSLPELQPLLASTHHYATWDDHDFGPNNSDRSFGMKHMTLEAFRLFWGNPHFGVDGKPGTTFTFQWADVQFFMLDNRYYRTPNNRKTGERTMLGEHQLQWLIDALVASNAPFKFVAIGGQVLNPVFRFEKYTMFAGERDRLLKNIEEEGITGVVFLSGDIHRTELTRLNRRGTYPLYEITSSPLTAGTYPAARNEPNYLRVEGTAVNERNFVILDFFGPRTDRAMQVLCYNKDGKQKWTQTIKAKDLK
jgi:alkaline phosphatase D